MPAERRCVFCRLPVHPGEPAYRLAPGFYPREAPDLFLEDDDLGGARVGQVLDAHPDCLAEAIAVK